MGARLSTLAIVTGITFSLLPLAAAAEESWYSVYREDQRQWTLSLTGGYGLLDLDGHATVDDGLGDTNLSLDGTLDLSNVESWWGEVDLQLIQGQHLRFAYTPMRSDGSETLSSQIVVDGTTYDVGDVVDSKLRFDQYEISYRGDIWLGEFLSIAPVVQLTMVDAAIEIENQTAGLSERASGWLPFPSVGARVEVVPLPRLRLFGEGKGLTIGSPATVWDMSIGASLNLTRNVSLMSQYRLSDYSVRFQDSEFDVRLGGPFFGTTVRF